jgi:hypothetical protein
MNQEFSTEEREVRRRRGETAPSHSAERCFPPSDPVGLTFDWVPHVQDGRITFQVRLERRGQKSAIDFTIDLTRLSEIELEYLHDFLARRHAGRTTHYEIAWSLSWLLERSIQQSEARLTPAERHLKVRQLLLAEPDPEKDNMLVGLGISPLLICVTRRARRRLEKAHCINVDDLEREAILLYRGLEQFERTNIDADFRAKAEAYTHLLIDHHRQIRLAGNLVINTGTGRLSIRSVVSAIASSRLNSFQKMPRYSAFATRMPSAAFQP